MSPVQRVAVGALALALVLAPGMAGYAGFRIDDATLRVLATVRTLPLLAALLLLPGRGGALDPLSKAVGWALGVAAGGAALSLLVHTNFLTSDVLLFAQLPAALDWLSFLAVFLVARRLETRERAVAVAALTVGMAWTAISAAIEFGQAAPGHRAVGTFFSPNFAAGFLGLALPVAAALCLDAKERLAALLTGVATALGFGALVASGSRSGIALGLVGLTVALVLAAWRRGGKLPWPRVGALLAAFLVLGFGFRSAVFQRAGAGDGQEHSGAFRTWTWKGAAAMAQANPVLGAGPGAFPYRYGPYAPVEWTAQAHSSYLQAAAENGIPAGLAAAVAAALALAAALRKREDDLLAAGVAGGLLVGLMRGALDSEWAVLGDALPFWALAGLACGAGADALKKPRPLAYAWALPLLPALALVSGGDWPPTADHLASRGDYEGAARIEPSARSFYRLAQRQSDPAQAVAWLTKARDADPNSQQTLRSLALAQAKAGDAAGALATWKTLVARHEGLPGQVRAMPELPETYAAYAYAALAADADARGAMDEAAGYRGKALNLIVEYSKLSPTFQQVEVEQTSGPTPADRVGKVRSRRAELRTLYEDAVARMPARASEKADVLSRFAAMDAALDKMLAPGG